MYQGWVFAQYELADKNYGAQVREAVLSRSAS